MGIITRNVERCKRGAGLETCFCGGAWSRRYAVDFFLYSFSLSSKKGRKEGQGSALDPVGGGRDPAGLVGLFCLACGPFLIRRPWRAHRLGARGRGRYPLYRKGFRYPLTSPSGRGGFDRREKTERATRSGRLYSILFDRTAPSPCVALSVTALPCQLPRRGSQGVGGPPPLHGRRVPFSTI